MYLKTNIVRILLLSVHESFVTFIHWTIEDEYIDYLRSNEPPQTLPFLELYPSKAYNLGKVDDRLEAVYGIMALAAFLDEEDNIP